MLKDQTRREFIAAGAAAFAAGATGVIGPESKAETNAATSDVCGRQEGSKLKISCCAYSFNRILPRGNKPGKMTMDDFVDLCAKNDLDGTELTSYYFPPDADVAYFRRIRRRAYVNGLEVSGTSVGNTFTLPAGPERDKQLALTRHWIDVAADLAAPMVRIFAGHQPKGQTIEQARDWLIECIEQCLPQAEKRGVFLALENHGGIVTTSDQTLACVKAIKSDWFGLNLDTGNFREPDPYQAIARCAPYAVNVHLKVHVQSTTKGSTPADFGRIASILAKSGYRGYVSLEYEEKEDPSVVVPKYLSAMRAAASQFGA
jgi:sugar phosphate isomerase/epimerase